MSPALSAALSGGGGAAGLSRVDYDVAASVDDDPGTNTVDSATSSAGQWAVTLSGRTAATNLAHCASWLIPLKNIFGTDVSALKAMDPAPLLAKLVGASVANAIIGISLVDSATVAGIARGVGAVAAGDGTGWEVDEQRCVSGTWSTFSWSGTPSVGAEYLVSDYVIRAGVSGEGSIQGNCAYLYDADGDSLTEKQGSTNATAHAPTHLMISV
jgi:hypothetical protein